MQILADSLFFEPYIDPADSKLTASTIRRIVNAMEYLEYRPAVKHLVVTLELPYPNDLAIVSHKTGSSGEYIVRLPETSRVLTVNNKTGVTR